MPQFRLHLEWDDEYINRDVAKADLQQIWEEIEQLSDNAITLEVFDVVPHPAKGGGDRAWDNSRFPEPSGEDARARSDNRIVNSLIPPFQQTHPWDEGVDIFPPDHPLHRVEVAVRDSQMPSDQKDEVQEEMMRALPQTTDPIESDHTP